MYLMDIITDTAETVRAQGKMRHHILGIFPILQRKLEGAPRYLFDENTIATAVELTLGRPKILREAMAHLTIPYSRMWIEWPESGRDKLRKTFGPQEDLIQPDRPLPRRLGFLLEVDETGRKGTATWVWNNHLTVDGEPPNVCPVSPFFDLDNTFVQDELQQRAFLSANLCNLWVDKPLQLDALLSIWATSVHKPSDWGNLFLGMAVIDPQSMKNKLTHFYADVYGEYIMIWACLMLLTSSRKIVEYKPIDNAKWNKARAKQGKTPRLNYTVVTMHINKEIIIQRQGMPLGYTRKSPRIHMVGSFLNRRGNKHWIVQPFWRGSGDIISRHVRVKP